jgi:hypothetical protein
MVQTETAGATSSGSRYGTVLLAVLLSGFILLIIVSMFLVTKNFRPTLNWDQWGDLRYIFAFKDHQISFRGLFAQNNEHRIFTERLLFLIDATWFGYRNTFLVSVIFASHLLLGAIIGWLWLDRTYGNPLRVASALGGAAALVSIAQYENLLWGFQTGFVHVYLFALLALVALCRACTETQAYRRYGLLLAFFCLYTLSTFTMANGVLLVGAALIAVVLMRPTLIFLATLPLAGVFLAWLYFYNYQTVTYLQLATSPSHFRDVFLYILYFLAAPFAHDPLSRTLLGGLGVLLLLGVFGLLLREVLMRRPPQAAPVVLACAALFAVNSAAVTAVGRVASFGLAQATSARYATPAIIFWLSAIGAAYWLLSARFAHARWARTRQAAALILLYLVLVQTYRLDFDPDTRRGMNEWALRIDRASVAIVNNVYLTDRTGLDVLFLPPVIREYTTRLRDEGWSLFSPSDKTYAPPVHLVAGLPVGGAVPCRGFIDSVARLDGQRLVFRGWLHAGTPPTSPDWVLVRDSLGGVIGYFFALDWRPDLVAQFGATGGYGFIGAVDFKQPVASGKLRLSFAGTFAEGDERSCSFESEVTVPEQETTSSYGELPGRAIAPMRTEQQGNLKPSQTWPPLPPLPSADARPLIVADAAPGPSHATFSFDLAALGQDDLAIPIGSLKGNFVIPVDVETETGSTLSMHVPVYRDNVFPVWRLTIIRRANLPKAGRISITVNIPAELAPTAVVIGLPFATPPNPNRGALY